MKKLLYILVIALMTSFVATSCTEEEVAPTTELDNGGGAGNTGGM